jgi:fluoride exporter
MTVWIGVAVLGALGSYARYALSGRAWGTFAVNVSGAFALGVLTGLEVTGDALLMLGTGLLGAYTTFSTWIVEDRHLALSMLAGLAAAGLGWLIGATFQ